MVNIALSTQFHTSQVVQKFSQQKLQWKIDHLKMHSPTNKGNLSIAMSVCRKGTTLFVRRSGFVLLLIFYGFDPMGFITIFHHQFGRYLLATFSIRSFKSRKSNTIFCEKLHQNHGFPSLKLTAQKKTSSKSRWWQLQIFFMFTPKLGEDFHSF